MKISRHTRAFLFTTLFVALANTSFAQHPVLFETFTNSYDLCPAPNTFDQEFKATLTSKGSKVIHLNHHVTNTGDPMVQAVSNSNPTINRLSGSNGSSTPVFVTAVDRVIFPSSGNRLSTSQSEWENTIDDEAQLPAMASITLVNATFDKSVSQYSMLHGDLDITALQNITDTIRIKYAVLQDNFSYAQCNGSGPSTHNDVVRYITVGDSIVFLPGTQSGVTKHVVYNQKITAVDPRYKAADMKLVAFIEAANGGNYRVVNAALLKKDLDTLQSPPKSLTLLDISVDSKVYQPGDVAVIQFQSSNIPTVMASYSLDNGVTWHAFSNATISPIHWTVPDSGTTQGKFKIEDARGTLTAIQKGNFTILQSTHLLKILHPNSTDVWKNNTLKTIQWTKHGVDTVRIDFSTNGGLTWATIAPKVVGDTIYHWLVQSPPTTKALISLLPIGVTDIPASTSEQFTVAPDAGVEQNAVRRFEFSGIYPNPALHGADCKVTFNLREDGPVTIQLLDVLGREVYQQTSYYHGSGELSLKTQNLPAGNYIVRLFNGDESISRRIQLLQ